MFIFYRPKFVLSGSYPTKAVALLLGESRVYGLVRHATGLRCRVVFCCAICTKKYAEIHYDDVITGTMASQITSLTIVYSTVYSGADQRKHQSSASLAFVRGIHRGPVNSPHKWPVMRKMFPFDDVIMNYEIHVSTCSARITCMSSLLLVKWLLQQCIKWPIITR